ncbi:MAG TPA: hypothetical protein P5560_03515 [Thermotogota bacterium]|nr:hypothetical protein [Thermotogota bacterium]HRW91997.1 hypothetical protein [Thermotogota bacterium]
MNLWEHMKQFEKQVFSYELQEAMETLNQFIEQVNQLVPSWGEAKVKRVNDVLLRVNEALQNQDFLLACDLVRVPLQAELKKNLN